MVLYVGNLIHENNTVSNIITMFKPALFASLSSSPHLNLFTIPTFYKFSEIMFQNIELFSQVRTLALAKKRFHIFQFYSTEDSFDSKLR